MCRQRGLCWHIWEREINISHVHAKSCAEVERIMADLNIAKEIIQAVGGVQNVKALTHCMTRLRFSIYDESKVNDAAIKKIAIVKGLSKPAGQVQIILGTGTVDEYFELIEATYKFSGKASEEAASSAPKGGNPVLNIFAFIMLITDLIYAYVDPRIKAQYVSGSKSKTKE